MQYTDKHGCSITGVVTDKGGQHAPIAGARITVCAGSPARPKGEAQREILFATRTDHAGRYEIRDVPEGAYQVHCAAFGLSHSKDVTVESGRPCEVCFPLKVNLQITTQAYADCEKLEPCSRGVVGRPMVARVEHSITNQILHYKWNSLSSARTAQPDSDRDVMEFTPLTPGPLPLNVRMTARQRGGAVSPAGDESEMAAATEVQISDAPTQMIGGKVGVTLGRTSSGPTLDQALWVAIRNRTRAISFGSYRAFINRVLCRGEGDAVSDPMLERQLEELGNQAHGVGAYQVLKTATEVFLLLECGIEPRGGQLFNRDEESARLGEPVTLDFINGKLAEYLGTPAQLPYITRVIGAAFPGLETGSIFCDRVLTSSATQPCLLELIWSYWHEEGMLTQTINAVGRRFQNVRGSGDRDPLAHLEIDPLRPMNNLLWGRIQDEPNRLTVKRRAYEYDHHYGVTLYGKAVAPFRAADSRSKFLEGFHNLLHQASVFFKEDNDTTVIADGYPLLNSLKEVHLLLAQGAHNQFGDLPWTARAEMLIEEWLLARSELRDFLQSRAMVPYKEPWMPQVDTMKTMQGWSDVTVTHFRDLGVYGEQLLLSVRYGDWIDVNDEDSAKNWARYWRPELQGYLHAYRAVTGIDLINPDTVDA